MKFIFSEFIKIFQLSAGQSGSNNVGAYVKFVLDENKVPYNEDRAGNIYNVSKKGVPLFCAHMDTVRDEWGIPPRLLIESEYAISSPRRVLGGDDLNGVFILLNLIIEKNINFLFTMDEETVRYASSKYFVISSKEKYDQVRENIPYFVVLDRKGNDNIIIDAARGRYGSEKFKKEISLFGSLYNYYLDNGIMCDADYLKFFGISGCNISVGYYNPHSPKEYVLWKDVIKAFNFCKAIISRFEFSEAPVDIKYEDLLAKPKKAKKATKPEEAVIVKIVETPAEVPIPVEEEAKECSTASEESENEVK